MSSRSQRAHLCRLWRQEDFKFRAEKPPVLRTPTRFLKSARNGCVICGKVSVLPDQGSIRSLQVAASLHNAWRTNAPLRRVLRGSTAIGARPATDAAQAVRLFQLARRDDRMTWRCDCIPRQT